MCPLPWQILNTQWAPKVTVWEQPAFSIFKELDPSPLCPPNAEDAYETL